MLHAVTRKQPSVLRLLLELNIVDPAARNQEAILRACDTGAVDIAQMLLEDSRVDCSARNQWAIVRAVCRFVVLIFTNAYSHAM